MCGETPSSTQPIRTGTPAFGTSAWNTFVQFGGAKMDLLRFENEKDSVDEPEVKPPAELVQLLLQLMNGAQQPAA